MKKGFLEMFQPLLVKLYKQFQTKHPMAAMLIGMFVIGIWGMLTALVQSNMLMGTPFEHTVNAIQNGLSFFSLIVTLLLNSSTNTIETSQVLLETNKTSSTVTTIETETPIEQPIENGSIADILIKAKKNISVPLTNLK